MRLWPPASSFASSPCWASSSSASSTERAATYPKLAGNIAALRFLPAPHPLGGPFDRFHDIDVAGAAAEIAVERVLDLFRGRIRVVLEQVHRRHDHARRAVAALQAVLLAKSFLHRMELVAVREPLDRRDFRAVRLHGENRAGLHRAPVQMNRACAALARVAADVRAGESEPVAQKINQQLARLDGGVVPDIVDGKAYRHALSVHSSSSPSHC